MSIEPIAKPTPRPKVRKPLKAKLHRIPDAIREAVYTRDGWLCAGSGKFILR